MGCGRVGSSLATHLDADGHSVSIIDIDPKAFSRLSPDFSGRRVTGLGMDRDTLRQAGIKDAYAFAAVSSGDNSNIIAARVARETFNVERVVARIYDPTRASVYERLGIPTVASVQRTTESVLRRLLPPNASLVWSHPTGAVSLVNATPVAQWYGVPYPTVEELTGRRIVFTSRMGAVLPASNDFVVQEYDQLYFAIPGTDATELRAILTEPPKLEA
ncbi:TrkA family potassium uptake protein [Schaalia sp. ZJ405]|uniref:potassium channel family protein n=1 Tax=unclassified Schaalia TaxID=2691889 RepID=UPI0013EADD98|nr:MULTISPECIES: TrkA family potassium uptake protein [unclassified Schaalia]QPK82211.1 TrkA family potassium uptake protein [Schaalia sp. ZJ405]